MSNAITAMECAHPESTSSSHFVERVDALSVGDFVARYQVPRRPVILTDALADWPARTRFTPEFFRREYADRRVRIRGRDHRLGEVLDAQLRSSPSQPAPYPCTLADCPELLADLSPRFACSLPNRSVSTWLPRSLVDQVNHLEIFFGGAGGQFPYLHYDMLHMHAWIAQVYGDKEFTLYERGQDEAMYPNPHTPWVSLASDSDDAEAFPLMANARRHVITLRAGEALFIPCGIWHTARCVTMSVTVAFDQLEASNWREFSADVVAMQRRAGRHWGAWGLKGYLALIGTALRAREAAGFGGGAKWTA